MALTLQDKHGRVLAEVKTEDEIIATGIAVGTIAAVVLKKPNKRQYSGYVKKAELDTMNVRTVQIPANFANMEAVDVPTRLREQYFDIYDIKEEDEYVEISARHTFYRMLKNNTLWKPTEDTEYTAAAACRNVLTNAMFPAEFEVASDCTDTLPGKDLDFERKNLVECFLDPENGICKKYGLSMIRDNDVFYCLKDVGYDRGFEIQDGKNLLGVERQENTDGLATRVAPYGKTAKGEIVWLNHNGLKYIDSEYINDYPTPYLELYDTGIQIGKNDVTEDNIQEKLLEAGQKRFTEDEVDKPEVTLTIEFISLGDTEEYAQYRGLDKVYLYDIITVRDQKRGYSYTAQVIGVEHDILTGRLLSVTIGSVKNADASRKIAVWQVPEVNGANIRLLSIQAGAFEPGAVGEADLQEHIIKYAHFASATIDSLTTDALEAAAAHIHELIAGSITADDIQAGSITTVTLAAEAVTAAKIAAGAITTEKLGAEAITAGNIAAGAITTEKLAANAVTAAKINAGAVTADKIAAGAITANKIDTTDLAAINATLGTASIADARIANADIGFAQIKDLNAQSAYFGQAVFQEAVGGKLYVPRLSVGYAQMIGATIGDLVIQASNGNFYGIDVDLDGNVTATQRTVSAGEIAAGHTTDGRTLVLGTDILATDLNTQNIYAGHALMNEIAASTISVDELWARTAFINKLMTTDISSNTYIQATIGNWQSGSTITQTINSLNSRISSLGYGTVYFQSTEPKHADLVAGDIWIQSTSTGTWNTVKTDYASWQAIKDTVGTWQTVGGIPKMFIWDGRFWQEMYDALLPVTLETEIQQLSDAIALRATKAEIDVLSDDITEFSAQLTIQAQEIQSAVSAVNAKTANYIMLADPRTAYTIVPGDTWTKTDGLDSWNDIKTKYASWNEVKTKYDSWLRILGSATYTWNGSEWIETSDRASELWQKTLIDQTSTQVEILAAASATLGDELVTVSARLTVAIDSIQQEVQRATTAENSKIAKTNVYQTADDIVAAAESYVNGILTSKAQIEVLATGITQYVEEYTGDNYYSIKSGIDIKAAGIEISGSKYIKIKSGGSFTVDSGNFSISTAGAVTVNGSITSTSGTIGGWTLAANRLYSGSGTSYVGLDSTANGTYAIWAGNSNPASAKFWLKRTGEAYFEGTIKAAANSTLGGWTLGASNLHSGSGQNYIAIASSGTYAMWAGSETAASAPFRLKFTGALALTKVAIVGENNQETEINLRTYGLWKLNYQTVKSHGTNSITLSNGETVNFNTAASVTLTGAWSGSTYTVSNSGNNLTSSAEVEFTTALSSIAAYLFTANNHTATMAVKDANRGNTVLTETYDATALYNAVVNNAKAEGAAGVTVDSIDVVQTSRNGKKTWYIATTATASNGATKNKTITLDATDSYNDGKTDGAAAVTVDSIEVIQTSRNGKKIWYLAETATGSNGATKNATITLDATDSYNDGVKDGNNAARDNQTTIGTCYRITAHSGEWVKVEEIGTGYSRVPYSS